MRSTIGRTAVALAASLAGAGPVAAAGQDAPSLLARRAGLSVEAVPIQVALPALERSSGVPLAFSPDLLPPDRRVSCSCEALTVAEALERILAGTDLTFSETRRLVLIGRPPEGPGASPVVVRVVRAGDRRPVHDAAVSVGGRTLATGRDGRVSLSWLPPGDHEVRARALGYEEGITTVTVGGPGASPVEIELVPAPIPLAEFVIAPGRFGVLEEVRTGVGASVSREEIEATPQLGDDAFRTLKRIPGVASGDISTRLNVRGGSDRNLLVLLDGAELHEPYHLQDLEGTFGIVDVQSLGGIDLVTGGFGAEYGDKLTGVFDMKTRRPPPSGTRSTVGFSLSTASFINQGTLDGGRGQWLASLRRGWLDVVLALTDVEDDLSPSYWDALGKFQYLFSDDHLWSVSLLHAGDDMEWTDEEAASRIDSGWANTYAWSQWRASWTEGLRTTTLLAVGRLTRDRVGTAPEEGDGVFSPLDLRVEDDRDFRWVQLKQDWELDLLDALVLKGGIDVKRQETDYDYVRRAVWLGVGPDDRVRTEVDSLRVSASPDGTELGTYLSARARVTDGVWLEAGGRFDRQSHTGDSDWSPRLLGRWDLDRRTSLRASWGRYVQSQGIHELRVEGGEDRFAPSERADQVAVGIARVLGSGVTARVEAYRRTVDDPLPWYASLSRGVNPVPEAGSDYARIDPSEGLSRGIEVFLEIDGTGGLDGRLSYVLAEAKDRVGGAWAPRTLDQRHTVNVFGTWQPNPGWRFSASWQIHSGWPITGRTVEVELVDSGDGGPPTVTSLVREFGLLNGDRLPSYRRLDIRVTRSFLSGDRRLEVFLDVFNALDRTNVRGYNYDLVRTSDGRLVSGRAGTETLMPRLPTIGLRWIF